MYFTPHADDYPENYEDWEEWEAHNPYDPTPKEQRHKQDVTRPPSDGLSLRACFGRTLPHESDLKKQYLYFKRAYYSEFERTPILQQALETIKEERLNNDYNLPYDKVVNNAWYDIYDYTDIPLPDSINAQTYHPPLQSSWFNSARREFAKLKPNTLSKNNLRDWALSQKQKGLDDQGILQALGDKYIYPNVPFTFQEKDESALYGNMYGRALRLSLEKKASLTQFYGTNIPTTEHSIAIPEDLEWALLNLSYEDKLIALHLVNQLLVPVLNGDMRPIADFLPILSEKQKATPDENEELDSRELREQMRADLPVYEGRREDEWYQNFNPEILELTSSYHQCKKRLAKDVPEAGASPFVQTHCAPRNKPEFSSQQGIGINNQDYKSPYARIADWKRIHWAITHDREFFHGLMKEDVPEPTEAWKFASVREMAHWGEDREMFGFMPAFTEYEIRQSDKNTPRHYYEEPHKTQYNISVNMIQRAAIAAMPCNRPVKPLAMVAIPDDPATRLQQSLQSTDKPMQALITDWANYDASGDSKNGLMTRDDIMMIWMALDLFDAINKITLDDALELLSQGSNKITEQLKHSPLAKIASYALGAPYAELDTWEKMDEDQDPAGRIPLINRKTLIYTNDEGEELYRAVDETRYATYYMGLATDEDMRTSIMQGDRVYSLWDPKKAYGEFAARASERCYIDAWAHAFHGQFLQERLNLLGDILIPWAIKYAPSKTSVKNKWFTNLQDVDKRRVIALKPGPKQNQFTDDGLYRLFVMHDDRRNMRASEEDDRRPQDLFYDYYEFEGKWRTGNIFNYTDIHFVRCLMYSLLLSDSANTDDTLFMNFDTLTSKASAIKNALESGLQTSALLGIYYTQDGKEIQNSEYTAASLQEYYHECERLKAIYDEYGDFYDTTDSHMPFMLDDDEVPTHLPNYDKLYALTDNPYRDDYLPKNSDDILPTIYTNNVESLQARYVNAKAISPYEENKVFTSSHHWQISFIKYLKQEDHHISSVVYYSTPGLIELATQAHKDPQSITWLSEKTKDDHKHIITPRLHLTWNTGGLTKAGVIQADKDYMERKKREDEEYSWIPF